MTVHARGQCGLMAHHFSLASPALDWFAAISCYHHFMKTMSDITVITSSPTIRKSALPLACLLGVLLAGCSGGGDQKATTAETVKAIVDQVKTTSDGTSTATTLDEYKTDLAQRISRVNSTKVHVDRPQALLRSVIVIRFSVSSDGSLLRSDVVRTNRDKVSETTALATLRSTAPFPKPPPALLRNGKVDVSETWLFNNDGRFQLRSVAQKQMSE